MQLHEIDEHIEAHEEAAKGQDLTLPVAKICSTYQKIRPILIFVKGLLFWKPKYQKVIDEFISVGDGVCPLP